MIIEQYLDIKKAYPDLMIMYKIGSFYEFFLEDAIEASRLLQLQLTTKGKHNEAPVAMCGIPSKILNLTIARLLEHNKRIGIVEETRTPSDNKTKARVINRQLARIITPGTIKDSCFLSSSDSNILLGIEICNNHLEILQIDVSTGRCAYEKLTYYAFADQLLQLKPREILILSDQKDRNPLARLPTTLRKILSPYSAICITYPRSTHAKPLYDSMDPHPILNRQLLDTVLQYIYAINQSIPPIRLASNDVDKRLKMNYSTLKNLDIFQAGNQSKEYSLLNFLNLTSTPLGHRRIKNELSQPHNDVTLIESRLDVVEFLVQNHQIMQDLQKLFKDIKDIERIALRIQYHSITSGDLIQLACSVKAIYHITRLVKPYTTKLYIMGKLLTYYQSVQCLNQYFSTAINCKPGTAIPIMKGFYTPLDEARYSLNKLNHEIANLTMLYRKASNANIEIIQKAGYGYVIEIHKDEASAIPSNWSIVKPGASKINFTTAELTSLTAKHQLINERLIALENEIVQKISSEIIPYVNTIVALADNLAEIDMLLGFAVLSTRHGYVKPHFTQDQHIEIIQGQHPILSANNQDFVANDLKLQQDTRVNLIFGTNMSGKSTFMRQNALICIMAHMGSFVPCKTCKLPALDSIFCRIGSADDPYKAKSTFHLEMEEISQMLRSANNKSLCIIDEIGRGTTSGNGTVLAKAVIAYLVQIKAFALIATHHHSLSAIDSTEPAVANLTSMDPVITETEAIPIFSHKIIPGFHVHNNTIMATARLTNMPKDVISLIQKYMDEPSI